MVKLCLLALFFVSRLSADLVWATDTIQRIVWCYNENPTSNQTNPLPINSDDYGLSGVQPYCVGANEEFVCIGSGSSLNPYATLIRSALVQGQVQISWLNTTQLQTSLSTASQINQLVYNPNGKCWWAIVDSFLGLDGKVCLYTPNPYDFKIYLDSMIPSSDRLTGVAFAGDLAYVTDYTSNQIIALQTDQRPNILKVLAGPVAPVAIAFSPIGNKLYVVNETSSVTIFDMVRPAEGMSRIVTLDSGANLSGIALSPNGLYVYVSDETNSRIYVLDAVLGQSLGYIGVSQGVPISPTMVTSTNRFLYVLAGSAVSTFDISAGGLPTFVSNNVFPSAFITSIAAQIVPVYVRQGPRIR